MDMRHVTHFKDAPETALEEHENESAIAKVKFLQLLVYLRRVILQDAVAYMSDYGWEGPVLKGDLFKKDDLFLAFKKELGARLSARQEQEFAPEVHPAVVNAIRDGAVLLREEVLRKSEEQERAHKDLQLQLTQLQHIVESQRTQFSLMMRQVLQEALPYTVAARQAPFPSHVVIHPTSNGEGSSSSQAQVVPLSRRPLRERRRPDQPQPQAPPQPQAEAQPLALQPEPQEPSYRYNHTTATSVYKEHVENQRRERLIRERKAIDKTYLTLPVDNSDLKQKSLRKKIFDEAVYIASTRITGSQEERIVSALAELDAIVALNNMSTNQLSQFCKRKQDRREQQRREAERLKQNNVEENNEDQ